MSDTPEVGPEEEVDPRDLTHVTFRIKTDQILFYKRMANWFYENQYINEPKLSVLAKACLNIVGHKFVKVEEVTYANFIQKQLAQARGPNSPYVRYGDVQAQQPQQPLTPEQFREYTKPVVPTELKRAPPVDKVKTPEWVDL